MPAWWRFAQCVRRYFDEGHHANPHLLNACKYATAWLVVIFSTLTELYESKYSCGRRRLMMRKNIDIVSKHKLTFSYQHRNKQTQDDYPTSSQNPFFVFWIISLFISSTYIYVWDIKMDWGLFDAKAPREYRFLREELVYPVKYYYVVIVVDLFLRFGWTLNLSLTEIGNIPPDKTTLVLAPTEIFRRFLWNFYRLENEHLNNCGEFRAVRDISISGQNIDMSVFNRILRIMDEPDGLTTFRAKVKSSNKKKSIAGFEHQPLSNPSAVLIM